MRLSKEHLKTIIFCTLFQAGGMGILVNSSSLFFTALSDKLSLSAQEISMFFSIRTLASALFVTFMTKLFYKWGVQKHLTFITLILLLNYISFAWINHAYELYLLAILSGLGISTIIIPIPIIINNWFKSKKGMIQGIVFSSSGIVSAGYSILCGRMIPVVGIENVLFLSVAISALLMLPGAMKMIYLFPSDRGVEPYQVEDNSIARDENTSFQIFEKRYGFFLLVTILCLATTGSLSALNNYLPMMTMNFGHNLEFAATVASFSMIGNVLGKFVIGAIFDKVGIIKTATISLSLILISMFLFAFSAQSPMFLLVGSLLYGFNFGLNVLFPSMLISEIFSMSNYKKIIGFSAAITSVLIAIYSLFIGVYFQNSQSFIGPLVVGILFCIFSISCLALFRRTKEKNQEENIKYLKEEYYENI